AAQGFAEASGALDRADANTAQLVRLQAIQNNLVRADADATNAFLVGGLEPAAQRADYQKAVGEASRLIADAARSQPADNAALDALNNALLDYTGLVEQARANNRQGLPVGAQYLRNASSGLRSTALPLLENLVKANQERVTTEFDGIGRGYAWLSIAGLLALVAIGGTLYWLARRTHRYVNVPLAIGGIAVLLATFGGATALSNVGSKVDDIRHGPYDATLALAQARIAAYDAKSNESLTLISRGSGAAFEKAWQAASKTAGDKLAEASGLRPDAKSLPAGWKSYTAIHTAIRSADDNGKWEDAVDLAIGTTGNTSNQAFTAFDTSSATVLGSTVDETRSKLSDAGGPLPITRWLCFAAGLLAAICAWLGVSQRLEEYR
ncbi:MAG TPA: hypothetical protein VF897_12615, partial [Roseiflexaceae bacterium]